MDQYDYEPDFWVDSVTGEETERLPTGEEWDAYLWSEYRIGNISLMDFWANASQDYDTAENHDAEYPAGCGYEWCTWCTTEYGPEARYLEPGE